MDNVRANYFASSWWCGAILVGLLLAGCSGGDPDRPRLYAVHGELVVKGQPASGARVILHPLDNPDPSGWPTGYPRAIVNAEGKFEVETYEVEDGAPAGKYKVLAYWLSGEDGQEEDPQATPRVNQIPPQFNDPSTSPWEVEIKPETNSLPRLNVP